MRFRIVFAAAVLALGCLAAPAQAVSEQAYDNFRFAIRAASARFHNDAISPATPRGVARRLATASRYLKTAEARAIAGNYRGAITKVNEAYVVLRRVGGSPVGFGALFATGGPLGNALREVVREMVADVAAAHPAQAAAAAAFLDAGEAKQQQAEWSAAIAQYKKAFAEIRTFLLP